MRRIVFLSLLFLFVLFSNQVLAHTSLQESSPKNGEIVTESIQELCFL